MLAFKQRGTGWAGSIQLQPITLKLPLKLVNDKENCVSIYLSPDTKEKKKVGAKKRCLYFTNLNALAT